MARAKDAAVVLAEKLVERLQAHRLQGSNAEFLPFEELVRETDPSAEPAVIAKALSKKPFKEAALVAVKKNFAAPVALLTDLELLAESARLLTFLLELLCTETAQTVPVAKLQAKLDPRLKKPFAEAVARQLQEQRLPDAVGLAVVRNKPSLYLKRMPPPPPPRKPEVELAEQLLALLESCRAQGGDAYPVTLRELLDCAGVEPTSPLIDRAVKSRPFKERTGFALKLAKGNRDNPAFFQEDEKTLAVSPVILEWALRAARTESSHAVARAALLKKVMPAWQGSFAEALDHRLATDSLPAGIGWLWIANARCFFFLDDIHGTKAGEPKAPERLEAERPQSPSSPVDFATVFATAFQRLDREQGSHNLVNLADLRRAVPVDRAAFDAGLQQLRLAGRYGLSAAEGRHGLTPDQQHAGIMEDGTLLLYVSRKTP